MSTDASSSGRPKRQLVKAACQSCQKRKVKCSGERPSCALCQARGQSCTYNSEAGMTRVETVKRRNKELGELTADYELVYHVLNNAPELEAINHLRRLREHPNVESYAKVLRRDKSTRPPSRKRPPSTDGFLDGSVQLQVSPTSTQSQDVPDNDSHGFPDYQGTDGTRQSPSPSHMIDPQLHMQAQNSFAFQNMPGAALRNLAEGWPVQHDPTLEQPSAFQANPVDWDKGQYQQNAFQGLYPYDAQMPNSNLTGVEWGPYTDHSRNQSDSNYDG